MVAQLAGTIGLQALLPQAILELYDFERGEVGRAHAHVQAGLQAGRERHEQRPGREHFELTSVTPVATVHAGFVSVATPPRPQGVPCARPLCGLVMLCPLPAQAGVLAVRVFVLCFS